MTSKFRVIPKNVPINEDLMNFKVKWYTIGQWNYMDIVSRLPFPSARHRLMKMELFFLGALLCQSWKMVSTINIYLYNAIYCKLYKIIIWPSIWLPFKIITPVSLGCDWADYQSVSWWAHHPIVPVYIEWRIQLKTYWIYCAINAF